jgi:putative membrane protein
MIGAWCGIGWGPGPWFLVFPLFWLAAVATFALIFRRRRWRFPDERSAGEVLGERYARGEISEDEYRQRLAVLRELTWRLVGRDAD